MGFIYTSAGGMYTVPDYELAKERVEDAVENEAEFIELVTVDMGFKHFGIFNVNNIACIVSEASGDWRG
jgi:hypothetical protein